MKVRVNSAGFLACDKWFEEYKDYIVLALEVSSEGVLYRISAGKHETPALHPAEHFEIVDGAMPSSWVLRIDSDGRGLDMAPSSWLEQGFWDGFFDDDVISIDIFNHEASLIFAMYDILF